MKKVLVICDLFPPSFGPRMGYLCKYLHHFGWEPTVLTERVKDEQAFGFLKGDTPVTYVDFRQSWLITFFRDFFFGYKDKRMYNEARKLLKEQTFDLILCSTFRTFPLQAASRIAQANKIPLVVDLRDIIEQYTGNEYISHPVPSWGGLGNLFANYFKRKNLRIRNKALKKAACVTTISPWHVEVLKAYNPAVELIYNGYDPEIFYPERIPTDQFIITYTGRLLSTAMRDPSLFMEALSRFSNEGRINPEFCQVHWYVDPSSWKIISEEARKNNVSDYMHFKGYVPATEIPRILNSSSILLLLTNKASDKGPKGIMTTKLFESFAVERPILCVRSDESYLEKMIAITRTGVAARTMAEACAFIFIHYTEWLRSRHTTIQANREVIATFSRKRQAEQFIRIFDRLTE